MAPDGQAETCGWEIWLKIHFNNCLIESCARLYFIFIYLYYYWKTTGMSHLKIIIIIIIMITINIIITHLWGGYLQLYI